MAFDRKSSEDRGWDGGGGSAHSLGPGKRTLTESMSPVAWPAPRSTPQSAGGGGGAAGEGLNTSTEADMVQEGTTGGSGGGDHAAQAGGGQQAAGVGQQAGAGAAGGAVAGVAKAGPEPSAAATPAAPATGETAAGAAGAAPAAAASTLYIMGPRELWFFDHQTPAGYDVARPLRSNRVGGTFRWSASANLTLSAAGDATPTVTSAAASTARRDAWIRLSHTDAAGATTVASYRVTILAPNSLSHLSDVDAPDPAFVYSSRIHYSILDQFGTVLPRNVPLNEQFTAAPTADSPGMDWRRGAPGGATVNPADWNDHVQGETPGHTPAPVAPGAAGAGTAVYHWPGIWRVGSTAIGSGRNVATVTWQKNRGFARHV
jgi:hypothetical protein